MTWLLWIAAVLVLWAGMAALRRRRESAHERRGDAPPRSSILDPRSLDDEIDRETLEQAELEVRDLDVNQQPDDGFQGDDWGPGAGGRRRT